MSPMNTPEIVQALTPLIEAFERLVLRTILVDRWQAQFTEKGGTRKMSMWWQQ